MGMGPMSSYRCLVVVGAQWGDEGKGKIVDMLAEDAGIVARYQGGANAGHTVHVGDQEFILHQIPSGILHEGKRCLLGNGVVLDIVQFFEELDGLIERGIDAESRVGISGRAQLLLEYHKLLDQANERARGAARIGTTGKGIGPAYEEKVARRGIRVGDLRDPERARTLVIEAAERANQRLEGSGVGPIDPDQLADQILTYAERVRPLITDTGIEISRAIEEENPVLLEGAQGALLDLDHGTYPYVTASTTTAGGAATGVGIGPTSIDRVLGVIKAYTTRVGSGPMPSEVEGPVGERLRELGGEFGATTGRARRCGWFDAVVARYSARLNGMTGLALTKLDVLDTFEEIEIVTAYETDEGIIEEFPDDLEILERAKPVIEKVEGWQSSTTEARKLEDLPPNARAYVEKIEELAGVPIEYIGVGTKREQIIRAG